MKILISPYSKKLRNDKPNPKGYPHWERLVDLLKQHGFYVVQVGSSGEVPIAKVDETQFDLSMKELKVLIDDCFSFISIDNFFQHYASYCGKKGIVLWGKSDPLIFGYPENINLLKDRKNLRKGVEQFFIWEMETFDPNVFVEPEIVLNELLKLLYQQ
jgi:ADP-heptose:LPS heptosyltransferase